MPESGLSLVVSAILARLGDPTTEVVLIDGPSGAGKSTLADALVATWPGSVEPMLVRMDDIYPGWDGLRAAGEHVAVNLLEPRACGERARWQRHDWARDTNAEWNLVPASGPLVIEGCGALTAANRRFATLAVWLDADDSVRKTRALARDEGAFDAHWDGWQEQFERFVDREDPESLADLVLALD
ncbi:AAA family ATPase [Mycetocola zhujimingii]|uniref:AAA family ATPase n=1 Tax=Mycetocola zhujimingii TaxID=2079792 RepID=UPI001F42673F|nr:AAA family ATPase [Mycetocola zhujimingii]